MKKSEINAWSDTEDDPWRWGGQNLSKIDKKL